jgi:hypothetical protein
LWILPTHSLYLAGQISEEWSSVATEIARKVARSAIKKLAMVEADGRCVDNLQAGPLPCDVYPSGKVKLEGGSELLDTPNSLVTMPTSLPLRENLRLPCVKIFAVRFISGARQRASLPCVFYRTHGKEKTHDKQALCRVPE